jgi:hypothetical protein
MELQGLAKRLYAEKLRKDWLPRCPEHADRLIVLDREHTQRRAEAIRVKYDKMRKQTGSEVEVL